MTDITKATQPPRIVTVGSESFEVRPLTVARLGRLQDWLATQPGPNAVAKIKPILDGLHASVQLQLLREARQQDAEWPPELVYGGDDAFKPFMVSFAGQTELVRQMLGVDAEKAAKLADTMTTDEFLSLINAGIGSEQQPLWVTLAATSREAQRTGREDIAAKLNEWVAELRPPADPNQNGDPAQ